MPAVAVTVTCPSAFVVCAVDGFKVAVAPLVGAEKVTDTPLTGLLLASVTVATNGLGKAIVTGVFWLEPPVAVIVVATPALLVRMKIAGLDTPDTAAMTE